MFSWFSFRGFQLFYLSCLSDYRAFTATLIPVKDKEPIPHNITREHKHILHQTHTGLVTCLETVTRLGQSCNEHVETSLMRVSVLFPESNQRTSSTIPYFPPKQGTKLYRKP